MRHSACGFHEANDIFRLPECIHVSASATQPPVDAITESRCIRHRDVKRAARFQNASDLTHGRLQFDEMFEAMIADDQIESRIRERQAGSIATHEEAIFPDVWRLQIQADDQQIVSHDLETAAPRTQVQHARVGR